MAKYKHNHATVAKIMQAKDAPECESEDQLLIAMIVKMQRAKQCCRYANSQVVVF
jgi:hypothetical protein